MVPDLIRSALAMAAIAAMVPILLVLLYGLFATGD